MLGQQRRRAGAARRRPGVSAIQLRSSVPETFSSWTPQRARHHHRLGHHLEAEPAHEAVAHQVAEPLAADGAERADGAVDRQLAPARAGQVVRHLDRTDRFEQRAQGGEARVVARRRDGRARSRPPRCGRRRRAPPSSRPTRRSRRCTRSAPTTSATYGSHRPFWKQTMAPPARRCGARGARRRHDLRRLGGEKDEIELARRVGQRRLTRGPRTTRVDCASRTMKPRCVDRRRRWRDCG